MNVEKFLQNGVEKGIITSNQKSELLNLLNDNNVVTNKTPIIVKVLYYIGGFIMLCAMITLMSHTIQNSSYFVILLLGVVYGILFFGVGEYLSKKDEYTPANILYLLLISIVAFIILDIEKMTGFFPHFSDIDKLPNYFELCRMPIIVLSTLTILINSILQKYRKADLLAIPMIICSYTIYGTILHYVFNDKIIDSIQLFTNFNLLFSIVLLVVAFLKDKVAKVDYSAWLYLFGSITLFQCLIVIFNLYFQGNTPSLLVVQSLVFVLSIVYGLFGLLIQRKIFSLIGFLGVIEYFLFLEFTYITNNTLLLTSMVLITGLIILYGGVLYNQNYEKLIDKIESILPNRLTRYLPKNR